MLATNCAQIKILNEIDYGEGQRIDYTPPIFVDETLNAVLPAELRLWRRRLCRFGRDGCRQTRGP